MNFRHIFRSVLIVAFFFGLDTAFGLVQQVIQGRVYGAGAALDAYNAANNLPDALFTLISGGALAIAFIPVLTEYLDREGRNGAWMLFSNVANAAFLITAVFAVVIALLAEPLVRGLVAPMFLPDQQALVVSLMRLYLIATLLFSLSGLVVGGLQANQHFLLPALAPIMYNLGQIFGLLVLVPRFGIYGLAYGVILGAAMHFGIQVPGLVKYGFRWAPRIDLNHPGLRRVAALMGPRILTMGALQLIPIATDNFASGLPEGAITALFYGWRIMQVPETVIGTAIGVALLPTLSEFCSRQDDEGLRNTLSGAVRAILALTVPSAVALVLFIRPLVGVVFEGGEFNADDTALVAFAAQMFLLGLVGHSLVEVAVRTFYARQDARTPLLAAWGTLGVFVGLSFLLMPRFGHGGIALANSIAFTAEGLVLLALHHRWHKCLDLPSIFGLLARVAGATLIAILASALFAWLARSAHPFAFGAGGLALAAFVYLPLAFLLLPDFRALPRLILSRI